MSRVFRINDLVLDESKYATDFIFRDKIVVRFNKVHRYVDRVILTHHIWRPDRNLVFYTKRDELVKVHNKTGEVYTKSYLKNLFQDMTEEDELFLDDLKKNSYSSSIKKEYFGKIDLISKCISDSKWEVVNTEKSDQENPIETKSLVTIANNVLDFNETVFSDNYEDLEDYRLLE